MMFISKWIMYALTFIILINRFSVQLEETAVF